MVRCKFVCTQETRNKDAQKGILSSYDFMAVTSGSEENKEFFAYTPSGSFKVGTVHSGLFEVGKEYYFDISEAVAA